MQHHVWFVYKCINTKPKTDDLWHTNISHELVYFLDGEGCVQTEEETYRFKANDIVLIPAGVPHNELHAVPHSVLVLGFRPSGTFVPKIPHGKFTPDKATRNLLEEMYNEMTERKDSYRYILTRQLEILLMYLQRLQNKEKHDGDFKDIVQNVEAYIETNISSDISLDDFSRMYHYSKSRFGHLFTETVGVPPKQFVIKKRLEQACKLLEDKSITLTKIALECGFYDSSQFSRIFKKNLGIAPSEYRESVSAKEKSGQKTL